MYLCAFRLDDITPEMNMKNFLRIRKIFDENNIKPLIGVVPDNQDETLKVCPKNKKFWQLIRELNDNGWRVAQHGYTHCYCTKEPGMLKANKFSEFAGLSLDEQYLKIKKGKELLEEQGIFSDIFMAPGHTFDKNTLKALRSNGFRYVTDGYSKYPFSYMDLKFIPCMHVIPIKTRGVITVCIHLNNIEEEVLSSIEEYIIKYPQNIIDFREALIIQDKNVYGLFYQRLYIFKRKIKRVLKNIIARLSN